jgi:hypothetical protein
MHHAQECAHAQRLHDDVEKPAHVGRGAAWPGRDETRRVSPALTSRVEFRSRGTCTARNNLLPKFLPTKRQSMRLSAPSNLEQVEYVGRGHSTSSDAKLEAVIERIEWSRVSTLQLAFQPQRCGVCGP